MRDAEIRVPSLVSAPLSSSSDYGQAMDVEWAKDGSGGLLYILQARPGTVVH
ncbi:MAG: PEP/pyruvate-binding domain-containing protein [Gammaproteobacteria bacterium]